eukprot:scaffold168770_cov21-Tisochrysis_lutea.AAC.3
MLQSGYVCAYAQEWRRVGRQHGILFFNNCRQSLDYLDAAACLHAHAHHILTTWCACMCYDALACCIVCTMMMCLLPLVDIHLGEGEYLSPEFTYNKGAVIAASNYAGQQATKL